MWEETAGKVETSILEFLNAFQQARVPPLDTGPGQDAPPGNALKISQYVIVILLITIARSILAHGDMVQISVTAAAGGIALTALLLVGVMVRMFLPTTDVPDRTQRGSVFVVIYLTLSLILYVLIDVVAQLAWGRSFTSALFIPIIGALGLQVEWGEAMSVLFYSLLAWGLLAVKTKRQFPETSWLRGVLTIQLPLFVVLNSLALYVLVLMPI
jgi:hypothetical protein